MSIRYFLIIALFFCIGCGSVPTVKGTDPNGWRNLRWGMLQDEVLRLYPQAQEKSMEVKFRGETIIPNKYINFAIDEYTDVADTCEVIFSFDSTSRRLESIAFVYYDEDLFPVYERIGEAHESKYGKPIEDSGLLASMTKSQLWLLPKTKIKLVYHNFIREIVVLSYEDAHWFLRQDSLYFEGWETAIWGMTEDDLLDEFPHAKKLKDPIVHFDDGDYVSLTVDSQKAFGSVFNISFVMDSTTHVLKSIEFRHVNPHVVAYKEAASRLIAHYGEPFKEPNLLTKWETLKWIYPKTTIELNYFNMFEESVLVTFSQSTD